MTSSDAPPPSIEPDTRDWTWVLDRTCPECGFVAADLDRSEVGTILRDVAVTAAGDLAARFDTVHGARRDVR